MHHISVSGHNEQIKHELSGGPEYNINFGQTELWKDILNLATSTMPKSERDETHMSVLTQQIFSAMLDELIMDATLQSHHEVARSRVVCSVCNTRCGSVHLPSSSDATASSSANVLSRPATPSSAASNEFMGARASATGTSTPTGKDSNLYLVCVVCSRQIASNRYAPHLASCMGLSSARRGAVRSTAKSKLSSDAGRSASPMSEAGNNSDERGNGKGKAKPKVEESDFTMNGNGKRKRPGSPQISPNKKSKKGKMTGSPVSRVKADPDIAGLPMSSHYSPSTNSQSKVPSKLRDSSTASFLEPSSTSSRGSSPEAVPTPASSTVSSQSPVRPPATNIVKPVHRARPLAMGTGPPPKRSSPPRPQPIHVSHYDEFDNANETGSSTDTNSE